MPLLDPARVQALLDRARRDVDEGMLPSCQLAMAIGGEVVLEECFGDTTPDTRYVVYSATKPFVAATIWSLMGDGLIDVTKRVVDYIPEFGTNRKDVVTVEQVLLHTSGFPHAPLDSVAGGTREGRLAAFARWTLNWEPGTSFEYHPTSAHWVLAELIERVTDGRDYRDVVEERVTSRCGLPRVLGLDPEDQARARTAELVLVGEPATAEEVLEAFGAPLPETEVTDEALLRFNEPAVRAAGVPGGGGIMRARDLARFYQCLLHNPGEIWRPDVLQDATTRVRNRKLERWMGYPANRALGVILAGDDGFSHVRGLGRTLSPFGFGHPGARGQIAWADPVTGLSFGYVTNGLDRHAVRDPRRTTAIASLAGLCRAA